MTRIDLTDLASKAINTPTAQKVFKALDAWLDRQIDGPREDKDEAAQ